MAIEPTRHAVCITESSSNMDAIAGNVGIGLQQLQCLVEARRIGSNMGKIGHRRQRQEFIGKLIQRDLSAIGALQMRLEFRPAREAMFAGKDKLDVLKPDIGDIGKVRRDTASGRCVTRLSGFQKSLGLLF
uniref:hypothetical protein n=1 Tax=Rhizobium rhizogenes TaxID=359 RepID=UPI001F3B697C|nr:hypothetical protein [Rhizobium rhizogenes]